MTEVELRRFIPWMAFCLLAAEAAAASPGERQVVARLLSAVRAARRGADLPALSEPPALASAAQDRASEIVLLLPRRFAGDGGLEGLLEQQGIRRFRRVSAHVGLVEPSQEAEGDASDLALTGWREDAQSWARALDPEASSIGIAAETAADGTLAVVILLVDEGPLRSLRKLEQEVEREVNRIRARHGLRVLAPSKRLIEVARAHSEDMARRNYFDHHAPDGRGPAERVRTAGILYRKVAENLGMNFGMDDPVRSAVWAWMDSPGHRTNILDPVFREGGVGIAEDAEGSLYFTQLFLEPAPEPRPRRSR